jgi:SAM-dependent methyltransferase
MRPGKSFRTRVSVAFDFLTCTSKATAVYLLQPSIPLYNRVTAPRPQPNTHRAISHFPSYPTILHRLKASNETFLDLGCCFGQEIRRLVHDGAPSSQLYGADLRPEFFALGYSLFRDSSTLKTTFLAADIFDPSSPLKGLEGKVNIMYCGSFLHLFNYEQQVNVCKRIVEILRPKRGSVVLGKQAGSAVSGERVHRTNEAQSMFRHNEESFRKMWSEIGEATRTE